MQDSYYLSQEARNLGYRMEAHESVASTNIEAAIRAKQGDAGHLWIVAGEQTQGVGRRGRVWHSPPGNLSTSLLLVSTLPPDKAAQLSFVGGVSLAESLAQLTDGAAQIQLKWPNDMLLEGGKLGGILVERHPLTQGKVALIIGMGLNVALAPPSEHYATASLRTSGFDVTPPQLFTALTQAWLMNFALWDEGRGFGLIREKWLNRAAGLGKDIHIQHQDQKISGCFKTIDGQGQLMIETRAGEIVTIAAGDVHFGYAATWRPELS